MLLCWPGVGRDAGHADHLGVRLVENPGDFLLARTGDVRDNRRADVQGQERDFWLVKKLIDSGSRTIGKDERDDRDVVLVCHRERAALE